ncbi:sodium/glutamate symporter [Fusobacterium sp.]|uniref:sodium/glutamate symporter n=1 Tax=Fusobacterium sp. TaxID=68766 RepID=UPI0026DB4723|nr:sodium/glutamate symporter [Fusobacterium sp.]
MFSELLNSLGLLGLFLLLGTFLRAKIKFFQQTFMPASVIGGFLLLILGPVCFNILKISPEWLKIYSLLPGILIIPIVASVPLGLKFSSEVKSVKNVLPLAFIGLGIAMFQFFAGFSMQYIFNGKYDFYRTFGWELGLGFVGGHGTAGLLGNMLQNANLPYWETAQGVATTTATFGIVGGILIGMLLINFSSRKGYTAILKKPGDIPESFKIGYIKDTEKQPLLGRDTTLSASIDSLAFHFAIIFSVCLISFKLLEFMKTHKIFILDKISIWAYSIVVMFIFWNLMCKLKLDFLVDSKVKAKISGTLTEFAVIAAIASLPIKAVFAFIVPITLMCIIGFILTTFFLFYMCKYFLKDYWFEHMISTFGMSTGVFLTGILLLRICDPDFKSPVMTNYSFAYTIISITYFALLNLILATLLDKGLFSGAMLSLAIGIGFTILAILISKFSFKNLER